MSTFLIQLILYQTRVNDEGEGKVAFFSAKRWDRRNRADLIESAHDAQVVGPYRDSNPLRLIVLATMSEDYTTAQQHLHTATVNDRVYLIGSSSENGRLGTRGICV